MEQVVDLSKLSDSELSPEQLKKRQKNRLRAEKKRLGTQTPETATQKKAENTKPASSPNQKPASQEKPERRSREEESAERLKRKTSRVENNPDSSIVALAETNEARELAFKVDEVNAITSYTRANLGVSEKMTYEVGITILKEFSENVLGTLDKFLEVSHANGVGSRRSLVDYKEKQRKIKNKEQNEAIVLEKSIALENDSEKKEREQDEKELNKVEKDLLKAEEDLLRASDVVKKSKDALSTIKKQTLDRLFARYETQRERARAEKEAIRAAEDAARKIARAEKETAKDTEKQATIEVA